MKIKYFDDYDELSQHGSDLILAELKIKPDLLLCAATGGSPKGLYSNLQDTFADSPELFSRLKVIKLDEWVGLPLDDPGSCEHYLQQRLIEPLSISKQRYISFDPHAENLDNECEAVQIKLNENGPIDISILGLGQNGHIGFNEPADELNPHCHIEKLTDTSQQHGMVASVSSSPEYGLTLGMSDLLHSRKIILIISGEGKQQPKEFIMTGKISTHCPASFLWLHDNVQCLVLN